MDQYARVMVTYYLDCPHAIAWNPWHRPVLSSEPVVALRSKLGAPQVTAWSSFGPENGAKKRLVKLYSVCSTERPFAINRGICCSEQKIVALIKSFSLRQSPLYKSGQWRLGILEDLADTVT